MSIRMTLGPRTGRLTTTLAALAGVLAACPGPAFQAEETQSGAQAEEARKQEGDLFRLAGSKHFVKDFPARTADGHVNVVVEIPAGTDAKWEVSKDDGSLRWQFKDGAPRVVQYLGYPGNYGMIPQTLLPKDEGGDGDPLDVLILGPALDRGSVAAVRVIGVLELLDGGEQDDKLIAVLPGTALGHVESLQELDRDYPGVTTIVRTWFESYKGRGEDGQTRLKAQGFAGPARARAILDAAVSAYR